MVGAFSGSFSISMTYVCKRRPSGVFSLSSLYFMPYSDGFATYHINYIHGSLVIAANKSFTCAREPSGNELG